MTNYLDAAITISRKKVFILSGLLLPSLSRIVVRDAYTRALIELTATALAVERFRQHRGRLPANPGELAPQFIETVPSDPFDRARLRYHTLTRGYVIYSVDADGHDDGGREPPESRKTGDHTSLRHYFHY